VSINTYGYQQATGYIGYKQELSDNLNIDYAFSYDMFNFEQRRQNEIDNAYREDEYYGKILLQWQPNEQHSIAFGGELSHVEFGLKDPGWPDVDPLSMQLNPMPRWSTNMYSLLGEHQWTINDELTTFIGGRLDDHTYTDWMFSPRLAGVYTPTERDTWKLMWSRSVRTNFEEEMKAQAMDSNSSDISDSEILDNIELRYERQHSEKLDFAVSLFYHYNLELIGWNDETQKSTSIGTQKNCGVELEASYHTEKTRFAISHSYTKLVSFDLEPGQDTLITAEPYGYGDDLADWSNHITKLTAQHKLNDKWTLDASLRVYWGFPGMKDYDEYYPYTFDKAAGTNPEVPDYYDNIDAPYPTHPFVEDGWEKAYRANIYLNLGLQYKPSKDLTIGVTGYNLLGIFNKDFNKRNYLASNGDYRCHAPALGISLKYMLPKNEE